MYSFTWSHPYSVKGTWETGRLRGVTNFAWGSVFTKIGRKTGSGIVLTIWFFCYAKNGVGNQTVVGGSTGGENNWTFGYCGGPQSSSSKNSDVHIEKL